MSHYLKQKFALNNLIRANRNLPKAILAYCRCNSHRARRSFRVVRRKGRRRLNAMNDDIQTTEVLGAECPLDTVLATERLQGRLGSAATGLIESQSLIHLTQALAKCPQTFFQELVETTLELVRAGSAGISLLSEDKERFIWPAVAGALKAYIGDGTPRRFGPCGTVLDRNKPLLFVHPERHFTYLGPIQPSLEEVLLVPFYMQRKAVGTPGQ